MTHASDAVAPGAARRPFAGFRGWSIVATLAVFAAAWALRLCVVANTDIAWQITIAEKILAGQRLYVDLVEVNPPGPSYLYLPAVALAQVLGLRAEIVIDAMVFAAAGWSLWFTGRILARAGVLAGMMHAPLVALAATTLTVLPAQTFGEREHLAVIAMLPFLAVLVARAQGLRPALPTALIAGLCAGLAMAIKPQVAPGLALALGTAAWQARAWSVLVGPEAWAAVVIPALYAAVVALAFPRFLTDMVPLLRAVYLTRRAPLRDLVAYLPAVPLWTGLALLLIAVKKRLLLAPPYSILLAASAGFLAAYFMQGKGWPYHSYPMLALLVLALAVALCERVPDEAGGARPAPVRFLAFAALIAIAGPLWSWMNLADDNSALAGPIRAAKPHPSMLVISADFALGHPLVRLVEGRWVGRVGSLWITDGAEVALARPGLDPASAAALRRALALDRDMLVADIRENRPDIIVVERHPQDRMAWTQSDPALARALEAYRPLALPGRFAVLARTEAPMR